MYSANVQRTDPADVPAEPISQVRVSTPPSGRPRARSITVSRLPKREIARLRALFPPEEHAEMDRPRTRADCASIEGPCPWVSCRHHLYLDVLPSGNIKLNFPDLEPHELEVSCVLDVAAMGGVALERAGAIMNLSRERAPQLEERGLAKLGDREELLEQVGEGRRPARRLPVVQDGRRSRGPRVEFDAERFASDELDEGPASIRSSG